jgi:hypothetical protein
MHHLPSLWCYCGPCTCVCLLGAHIRRLGDPRYSDCATASLYSSPAPCSTDFSLMNIQMQIMTSEPACGPKQAPTCSRSRAFMCLRWFVCVRAHTHAQAHTYPRKPATELTPVLCINDAASAADDHGHMAGAAAHTDRFPRHALFLLHLFVLCAAIGAVKYGETCSRDTDCEEKSAPYCKIFFTDKSFEHDERFATTDWMYDSVCACVVERLRSLSTTLCLRC